MTYDQALAAAHQGKHELSDWSAANQSMMQLQAGVIVSVRVDRLNTYIELRQQGPGFAVDGTLVSFTRIPRMSTGEVTYEQVAGYLLNVLQRAAGEGWRVLR